ncbi:MAG TPA: acid phosphatase [Planctomycetaceae bacterium]|nr:acid phosphatase [Planctomycetaceae bacterium]
MKHSSLCLILLALLPAIARADDPLPSWNDGESKSAIIEFVQRVTDESHKDFVPVPERIAVFDNDGTLWCEAPLPPQVAFVFDEVKRMAKEKPSMKNDPAVQAVLTGDAEALLADGHKGLLKVAAITHAGLTIDEFNDRVDAWLKTATHPRFKLPYNSTIYLPMLEVLEYLRANGFETWIVSGGGQDFMRVFAEETYGIVPQQIIGSHAKLEYELRDGVPTLTKTLDSIFVDDKEGKPVGIERFIGRRPIACFGNSDGDQAMLEYTTIGNPLPSFGLIVRHTDDKREYAYDSEPPSSGRLVTALKAAPERHWTVVDMAKDWNSMFPQGKPMENKAVSLKATSWQAITIKGQPTHPDVKPDLTFDEAGRVGGSTGVNRIFGPYTVDGAKISFGQLATTRRAGPPDLMQQETQFQQALGKVATYAIEDSKLKLLDADGSAIIELSANEE